MVEGVKLLAVDTTQHRIGIFSENSKLKWSEILTLWVRRTIARRHRRMRRVSGKTFLKYIMSSSMNTFFFGFSCHQSREQTSETSCSSHLEWEQVWMRLEKFFTCRLHYSSWGGQSIVYYYQLSFWVPQTSCLENEGKYFNHFLLWRTWRCFETCCAVWDGFRWSKSVMLSKCIVKEC